MAKSGRVSSNRGITTGSEPEWVILTNLIAVRVVAYGESGKRYEWPKAGSLVKVLKSDAEKFLQERRGGFCCGGSGSKPKFVLVSED